MIPTSPLSRLPLTACQQLFNAKARLRAEYRELRRALSAYRRGEAERVLFEELSRLLKEQGNVLSFSSLPEEINISEFNRLLAKEGRLFLPKVGRGRELSLHRVEDIERDCAIQRFSILEPVVSRCEKVSLETIQVALIPGLAFDGRGNRLGYGSGYYDALLNQRPEEHHITTIGVGFKEQFSLRDLPSEPHDIPLQALLLR